MTENDKLIDALDARAVRRADRRAFFTAAIGAAAVGAGAFAFADPAAAQAAPSDSDVLNFALNLEYLEANFYSYAVTGKSIDAGLTTGTGTAGSAMSATAHAVPFQDAAIKAYAMETYQDELAHVKFLRTALGGSAVAQPAIDVGVSPTSAFSAAAQAAGVIGAGQTFDPYADDLSFLLGSFIFEDVGVTAYKGAAPLLTNPVFIEAAAGILAVEAYHAGLVRTSLYRMGVAMPSVFDTVQKISDARDSLDGSDDRDQGISPMMVNGGTASNIVPLDANGLAYSRTTGQVLNIVYLTKSAVTMGGFFPAGVNGTIKTSTAQS